MRRCIDCGKPIIPYKRGYTKCRKCFTQSVTNSYKKKKNLKWVWGKTLEERSSRLQASSQKSKVFLLGWIILKVLFVLYIIFNCLQVFGLTHYFPDGSIKSFLSTVTLPVIKDTAKIEMKVYELTNEERIGRGVQPLVYDTMISQWAQSHSSYLKSELKYEHSSIAMIMGLGENVGGSPIWFWVTDCGIVLTNNQIAECFIKSIKNSPEHYYNMISPEYTSIGVGVSCNLFFCYAAQMFL